MSSNLSRPAIKCRVCAKSSGVARHPVSAKFSPIAQRNSSTKSKQHDTDPRREDCKRSDAEFLEQESGPMTRRLEEATEEALLSGGTSGRRAIEDAGFSEELKSKLLDKLADANFKTQYAGALAEAGLPSAAGEGTRHMAAVQPWTGSETTEDAVLRMLDDAKKPLKPGLRGTYQPPPVDMRLKRGRVQSPGQRVANARDKASVYAGIGITGTKGLSDEERAELKKEFRERFQPGARTVPVTVSGIAALANERIENAIARGQFKDLPRGKSMERDPRADNPFIDSTEYILNKMIQRQDIVPPWIEKQQELVKTARVFRERLRNDWKRHAARMIASRGGSLQDQMKRARDYEAAEQLYNPRQRGVEQIAVPTNSTDHVVMVKLRQEAPSTADAKDVETTDPDGASDRGNAPLPRPFRDLEWEKTEHAYMNLSVENLNKITRSYNLMAPEVARKPYFSLERELAACFADVAPLVANEIKDRATGRATAPSSPGVTRESGGILGHLGAKDAVKIHLEADEKAYGFKEWWRDFWKRS